MGKLAIVDTADVYVKNKKSGKVFLTAEAQLTSITQSLGIDETIFGGIGSKSLFRIKGQKEVEATIRNALYDKDFLAMTQGVDVREGATALVHKTENNLEVTDIEGVLEVEIAGTPFDTEVYVRNIDGETELSTIEAGTVIVPDDHAKAGDKVSVTYQAEVTGDIIDLDADKFGSSFEVEYRTIGYDVNTNEVKVDIYIKLMNVIPSGDFEFALENGTALAPEFTFNAMAEGGGSTIGQIIEVPRNTTP